MRCPFLREAQVKFCQASAFRKMIVRTPAHDDQERCSSPDYVNCPAAKQHHEELPSQSHCPFLQESLAQYCSASPVTKFVPYSESLLSRCGNDSHRYCELFLAIARPESVPGDPTLQSSLTKQESSNVRENIVEGIPMPESVGYTTNHMWLDVDEDGCFHVGVDALMGKVLGRVENISFVSPPGITTPAAVFTVKGVDLQVVFPNRMNLSRTNSYLRANPGKLTSDPYKAGWLFEGRDQKEPGTAKQESASGGLLRGEEARRWMAEEVHRVSTFIHDQYSRQEGMMMDGGSFVSGAALQLNREGLLHLFNEFFSPYTHRR